MPEKFTFPSIQQAISLQSALSMEQIKVNLRAWFNKNNSLRLSQNVAWSFKLSNSDSLIKRYIHCKFCHAKLTYVTEIQTKDNNSNTFRLVRFNLHHDHRFIDLVKQQGKIKAFPQDYSKPQFNRFSIKKEKKQRKQKQRKKREQLNKFKKLQFYYRLNMSLNQEEKLIVNVKELVAKNIGVTTERFMCFLNSGSRGVLQVTGIKKILKNAGFEKYNIEMDNTSKLHFNKSIMEEFQNEEEPINSQQQEKQDLKSKGKKSNSALIIEQSKQFFKDLMLFINYNQFAKKNLKNSQGLINIAYLQDKIISKKFMKSMKWNALILYSHDSSFQPNQLYAVIMIESQKFNIRQIKKSFEITFKLLDPSKQINFKCCLNQQNIYIMGALDLIIEQNSTKDVQKDSKELNGLFSLSYFLSPKLSQSILNKCEFIPKIFRRKLIDKIRQLDPKQVDHEYQKIINELEKASKIKQYKTKTEEYIGELKQFYQNFHKIFLGKFITPSFVGLSFIQKDEQNSKPITSINDNFEKVLQNFSKGNKYFFEFIIMIFDIFQIPNGSFIYQKYSGDLREPTKLQKNYANHLTMPQYQYFDQMKKLYRTYAYKGKYYKSKTIQLQNPTVDFYQQFCALLYERAYKFKQIFMKVTQQVKILLIREIQKSFTLQIQTRTVQQLKTDGIIKIKQQSKSAYTVKIINQNKFWPDQKQKSLIPLQIDSKNIIELEKKSQVIELDNSFSKNQKFDHNKGQSFSSKNLSKKLWECDCNFSKFIYLPCCHQIRCCFTFFTSIEDQINDFWLFDPKKLQELQDDDNKSQILTEDEEGNDQSQDKEGQHNSQSD